MSNWVNFAEIRAKVSLEDVLFRFYGLDTLTRKGNKVVGPCPVHGGDSPRAFHAELDRNVWHCFSRCKKGGNQLDFVAQKEDISIREAALKLQAFFLDGENEDKPPVPEDKPSPCQFKSPKPLKPESNPPLDLHLQLAHDHPHLLEDRGLQLDTPEHFDVGYCRRGIMRGCITFPIHDEHGQLVAYAGRHLKPQQIREFGKYKFPKGFRKDLVLYNFHRAREQMAERGLILVEGFFSVLKLFEAGFENVVAAMGCELSDHHMELLMAAKEILLLFDGNEAGISGAEKAREQLAGRMPVRLVRLPCDTEPDDLSPQAMRWVINGLQTLNLQELSLQTSNPPPQEDGDG